MSDTYEHSDYPRMLYRKGGAELIQGLPCETMVVEAAEHEGLVHADGWRRTPAEAHGKEAPKGDEPVAHAPEAEVRLAEGRERIAELEGMLDERDSRISTLVDENEEMKALLEEATGPKDPHVPGENEPPEEPEPEAAKRRGRPPKVLEPA